MKRKIIFALHFVPMIVAVVAMPYLVHLAGLYFREWWSAYFVIGAILLYIIGALSIIAGVFRYDPKTKI